MVTRLSQPLEVGVSDVKEQYANMETYNKVQGKIDGFTHAKVWYMPGTIQDTRFENVAFASYEGQPDFEKPLAKFSVQSKNGGSVLVHKYYDNWSEKMKAWKDAMDRTGHNIKRAKEMIGTAAIVNSTDIDSTKNLNILDRVLGLQTRSFFLNATVTPIPANNLIFTVDTFTEGSVAGKVSELMEPKLITHTESRTTHTLYKNIGHIAISEEAKMKNLHNTMALRQDKTLRDLARLINSQIATEIETATGVGGADWGSTTGTPPDSEFNPIDDIQAVKTTIGGNGFNIDFIAAHDRPATDLLTNKFIRGRGNVGVGTEVLNTPTLTEQGIPGTIVQDQALTNTVAVVGSRDATWLGQGPTTVASYNNDVAGYEGWLAKQWWFPIIVQAGAIRKLTAISA